MIGFSLGWSAALHIGRRLPMANLNNYIEGEDYIFRAWTTVNGKKIYAKWYGIKAFLIWLR